MQEAVKECTRNRKLLFIGREDTRGVKVAVVGPCKRHVCAHMCGSWLGATDGWAQQMADDKSCSCSCPDHHKALQCVEYKQNLFYMAKKVYMAKKA